jgi:hypothetical protein
MKGTSLKKPKARRLRTERAFFKLPRLFRLNLSPGYIIVSWLSGGIDVRDNQAALRRCAATAQPRRRSVALLVRIAAYQPNVNSKT